MKVALIHDYLIEYGGAERVLEGLHEIWPQAPVFTALYDPSSLGSHNLRFKKWDIRTSFLQKMPFAKKLISPFRIFAPAIFENFNLSKFDLVISSCNVYFSKAVITKPSTLHISYIHTPPRYLYGYYSAYDYKKHWWSRIPGELINHLLRIYDFEISQRPDILVANSINVQKRIKKFYRRDCIVIYPPIDVERFKKTKKHPSNYFLYVGRLERGKGVETIITACMNLKLYLKIAGTGRQLQLLKNLSFGNNLIEFLGDVPDEELPKLYANAKALVLASEDEDFGITPIESMATGTPVIAPKKGGFLETIIDGKTGMFYKKADVETLSFALKKFDSDLGADPTKFKPEFLKKQAEKFSKERFKKELLKLIEKNTHA